MSKNGQMEEKASVKLILQEFSQNPYQRFNISFALMSVIPFMVFLYLLAARLFTVDIFVGDVGLIMVIALFVALCGLVVGYSVLKNTLKKVLSYAAKARKCSELRSIFVATVSHEFRNPLFQISSGIKNILEGMPEEIGAGAKKPLEECIESADQLWDLSTHLLDVYKIEAGMVRIDKKICDIAIILEEEVKEIEGIIDKRGIKLSRDIFGQDLIISADEAKIALVISKLLSSTLSYVPEGGEITLRVFPSDDFIRTEIQGSGKGVSAEELEKMFHKDEVLECKHIGAELGLVIARDIVELHKGHLWAESKTGKGIKFMLVLPKSIGSNKAGPQD